MAELIKILNIEGLEDLIGVIYTTISPVLDKVVKDEIYLYFEHYTTHSDTEIFISYQTDEQSEYIDAIPGGIETVTVKDKNIVIEFILPQLALSLTEIKTDDDYESSQYREDHEAGVKRLFAWAQNEPTSVVKTVKNLFIENQLTVNNRFLLSIKELTIKLKYLYDAIENLPPVLLSKTKLDSKSIAVVIQLVFDPVDQEDYKPGGKLYEKSKTHFKSLQ